jgi:Tfp pilus assembly protein PilF
MSASTDNAAAAARLTDEGLAKFTAGDLPGALADFEAALRLDTSCLKARINRGSVRNQQGDLAGAAEDFTAALALDPTCSPAYSNRGAVRLALKKYRDATADFDAALLHDPRNCQAHLMRAYVRYHRRDVAGSEADFRAALALDREYTTTFVAGQIIWSFEQGAAEVIEECDGHLLANPGDFHSVVRRGLMRLLLGQAAAAEPDFAEWYRQNPGSELLRLVRAEIARQGRA